MALNYNNGRYVNEFLTSLKSQCLINCVVTIVDDASTDGSAQDIISFVHEHALDWNVVINSQNEGINATIYHNLDTRYAFTKIIATDDIFAADAVTKYSKHLHNSRADILYSDGLIIDQKSQKIGEYNSVPAWFFNSGFFFQLSLYNNFLPSPTVVVKTSLMMTALETYSHIKNMEDWPLLVHSLRQRSRYIKLDSRLILYRRHAQSLAVATSPGGIGNNGMDRMAFDISKVLDQNVKSASMRTKLIGIYPRVFELKNGKNSRFVGSIKYFAIESLFLKILMYISTGSARFVKLKGDFYD